MPYGQLSTLGIVFQNSFGTVGDVNSIHWLPYLSESFKLNIPPMYSENMRGIHDEGDTYQGPRTCEGEIDCEAQPIALGAMLKSILSLESSVQSTGIYTHTFEPRSDDFDALSANNPVTIYAFRDTGSGMLYQDMNGASLEMSIANGEFFKVKVGYVGGEFSQNAEVAASLPTGKRWTWDQSSVSLGGSAVGEIVSMNIKLDDGGLEAMHTLDASQYPSRVKRTGFRNIAIDGTLKFEDQDEYQQFISQSEREMILHFEGSTEVQSGYNESLTIKLPLMRYEEAAPMAEGPGYIEMSVTGRGKYSVTSATALQAILVNTQATY